MISRPPMLRPDTFAMTALLSALTALGPLTVDMYLASMPAISRLLAATPAQVQLTISVYLIGFAIGQVFYGPLSDRHGRRPVILAALLVYSLASLACALAPSIELLLAARFCQALGGAGAIVLARAVVRDIYEGARVGRELSLMAAIMALAPIVAPLLGGVLQTLFGWRSNFVLLLMFGIGAAAAVFVLFPETLRRRAPERVSLLSVLRSYRSFLRHPSFVAHLGIATCAFLGLFAWLSTAPFVLQDMYGLAPLAFGAVFAVGSAGYLVGAMIAARFVVRWGIDRTIGTGCAGMAAGGLTMVVALALGWQLPATLVAGISLYFAGMGLVLPQAQAGALLPFPERAGAASSLMGVVQQSSAAVLGAFLGHALGATAWPLAVSVAAVGCFALVVWAFTRSVRAK
jgi:DHA1 family bicyclomycin/chloramphenicol resistance-like MFS transporter